MSDGQMSWNVTVVMETEVKKKGDVIISGEASYLSVLYFNKPPHVECCVGLLFFLRELHVEPVFG